MCLLQKVGKSVSVRVIERRPVALERTREQPAHLQSMIPKLRTRTQQTNARAQALDDREQLWSITSINDRALLHSIAYNQRSITSSQSEATDLKKLSTMFFLVYFYFCYSSLIIYFFAIVLFIYYCIFCECFIWVVSLFCFFFTLFVWCMHGRRSLNIDLIP